MNKKTEAYPFIIDQQNIEELRKVMDGGAGDPRQWIEGIFIPVVIIPAKKGPGSGVFRVAGIKL